MTEDAFTNRLVWWQDDSGQWPAHESWNAVLRQRRPPGRRGRGPVAIRGVGLLSGQDPIEASER